MTDTLSKPASAPGDEGNGPIEFVWLPPEQPKKKRYLGLWLGIPGGLIAIGAAICATILIAPGVFVAGVNVGWSTPGVASDIVTQALANTRVTLDTPTRDVTLTGEELGLTVDAKAIAQLAYGEHPLWNVGAWNPGDIPITVDADAATVAAALSAAAPTVFPEPVNAGVKYDATLASFQIVDPKAGLSLDVDKLASAVSDALSSGSTDVTFSGKPVQVTAPVSTAEARKQAEKLNALVANAGFYIDGAKVLGVDPVKAASWIKVTAEGDSLDVTVNDKAALADIKEMVKVLPEKANRPAVNEVIVTNSAGEHLRTVQEGADGWALGSTSGFADGLLDSFAAGDGVYDVNVTATPFTTNLAFRTIEVDKSDGVTILYENGVEVDRYAIAVGRPETPTDEGHFTVYAQLLKQDMGCSAGFDYCTKDVPWITYFNGDEGFHGTYWHNNFGAGAMMSHGCVNMTMEAAERVYRFAQEGTEIWVHA